MLIRHVLPAEREKFDSLVTHPIQSWVWGEFREKSGIEVIRLGKFDGKRMMSAVSMTVHPISRKIPLIGGKCIINCSRSIPLDKEWLQAIYDTAIEQGAISVKLEPNVYLRVNEESWDENISKAYEETNYLTPGEFWFAPYSAIVDLTKSDEVLLSNMKNKARYNLGLAKKHDVVVEIDNSTKAVERYLDLMEETTGRQGFYAHTRQYHEKMWEIMHVAGIADLLTAKFENKIITTWVLFKWQDKLFYPYGASTREHQEVMANYLVLWEAIQFGKKNSLKTFDLWGVLGPDAVPEDAWYGFHRFKMSFNPQHVQYAPTMELVIDKTRFKIFGETNKLRKKGMKFMTKVAKKIRP